MNKYLVIAGVCLVVMAVANRVAPVKKLIAA